MELLKKADIHLNQNGVQREKGKGKKQNQDILKNIKAKSDVLKWIVKGLKHLSEMENIRL